MRVTSDMSLEQLNQCVVYVLDDDELRSFRARLNYLDYPNTESIPETIWLDILSEVIKDYR